jgi:HEAT repeat protein
MTDAATVYPATLLRDLSSPDASVRLKASKRLESDLRKAATDQRKEQFGHPEVTGRLITALDDSDPQVVHNAVVALAQIACHYFKDDRAYGKLLPLVRSKHPLTSRWAIAGLFHLRGEASLDDILPLCAEPSPEVRAAVFDRLPAWLMGTGSSRSEPIQPGNRERLQAAALIALKDDDRTVRGNAANILGEVGDAASLSALRQSHERESYWLNEQIIGKAIERLEGSV